MIETYRLVVKMIKRSRGRTAATKLRATALLALAALQLAGCASTTQPGAVGAERSQLLLVSAEDMDKMSAQSYAKLRNEAASKGALNTDPALTRRVRGDRHPPRAADRRVPPRRTCLEMGSECSLQQ